MRAFLAAVGAGLLVGALSAIDVTPEVLANSISTWLVAPFLVGTLAATRRGAAAAGFTTCAAQLAGFYLVAPSSSAGLVAFWTACAIVGGPIFGVAGRSWRSGGLTLLAGVFIAEGLYAYAYQQHHYLAGALWIAIGLALASRGQWRWLGLIVPLGLAGEAALTSILQRFF